LAADRHIEVNALNVRRALAGSFVSVDPGSHTWRGRTGAADVVVTADVLALPEATPYVHVFAEVIDAPLTPRLAQLLVIENAELVLGRFTHDGARVRIEHSILAGTTMDPVEVQASVWTVGWAAAAFDSRLRCLLEDAVPPPPPPQTPAALRRNAEDHVAITNRRVRRLLDERYGGFEVDPAWGYHRAFGSARVFVDVLPVLEDSTAVRASSPVLSDVDLNGELAHRLLALAGASPFGAFLYLQTRRELWFQHIVLGDDLDDTELVAAVEQVVTTADGWDDELAAEFGGKRYADL
jgi:hypothetical protein